MTKLIAARLAALSRPTLARSSVASWQAGGKQDFPEDAIGQQYRERIAAIQRERAGIVIRKVRRPAVA